MARALTLREVRDFLYPIRLKWYDLGIELDVPGEELDVIKSKNRDDYGDMIAARLKFKDDPLTWKHLEDALKARAINEPQLAEEIWFLKTEMEIEALANFCRKYGLERSISCKHGDPPISASHFNEPEYDFNDPEPSIPTCPAEPSWKFPSITRRFTIIDLPCYHGAMRGVEAEEKLKQQPGDSHLIRYSDSQGEYILSVFKRHVNGHVCRHFVVNRTKSYNNDMSTYSVEGSDRMFHDAGEMLDYFRSNPISYEMNDIGEPCPATPVTRPTAPVMGRQAMHRQVMCTMQ